MLSNVSQTQRQILYNTNLYEESKIVRLIEAESKMMDVRGRGGVGNREILVKR